MSPAAWSWGTPRVLVNNRMKKENALGSLGRTQVTAGAERSRAFRVGGPAKGPGPSSARGACQCSLATAGQPLGPPGTALSGQGMLTMGRRRLGRISCCRSPSVSHGHLPSEEASPSDVWPCGLWAGLG